MKQKIHKFVIPAEEEGWELWTCTGSNAECLGTFSMLDDLKKVKSDCFLLPAINVITCVEQVFKGEVKLEEQTARTNLEMNSQIKDSFAIQKVFEGHTYSYYTGFYIDDLSLNKNCRNNSFGVFAETLKAQNEIVIYKEQGLWILACFYKSKLLHLQPLGRKYDSKKLLTEFRAIFMHLRSIGIDFQPDTIITTDLNLEGVSGFTIKQSERHQLFQLNVDGLRFVPKEVSAWRRQDKNRLSRLVMAALLLVMVSLAVVALFYSQYLIQQDIAKSQKVIDTYEQTIESNKLHVQKWESLAPMVTKNWALKLYADVAQCIPASQNVSLDILEINTNFIKIKGKSVKFSTANSFGANLKKHPTLSKYKWSGKAPVATAGGGHFNFSYEGVLIEGQEND